MYIVTFNVAIRLINATDGNRQTKIAVGAIVCARADADTRHTKRMYFEKSIWNPIRLSNYSQY